MMEPATLWPCGASGLEQEVQTAGVTKPAHNAAARNLPARSTLMLTWASVADRLSGSHALGLSKSQWLGSKHRNTP